MKDFGKQERQAIREKEEDFDQQTRDPKLVS